MKSDRPDENASHPTKSGSVEQGMQLLEQIAEALSVPVEHFFDPSRKPVSALAIFAELARLGPEDRERVMAYVRSLHGGADGRVNQ